MKRVFRLIFAFLTHRLFILLLVVLGMFYLMFQRIFDLQIVQGESLEKDFSLSIVKERVLEGPRGNIYDRNGYPLAENIIAYNVLLDGSIYVENLNQMIYDLIYIIKDSGNEIVTTVPISINEDGNLIFTESDNQIIRFKKNIFLNSTKESLTQEQLDMTATDMFIYMRDERFKIPSDIYTTQEILEIMNVRYPLWLNRYTQYQLETIAININEVALARIEENRWKFPGVSIATDTLRVYNDPIYFSHIIGYTGKIDAAAYEELKALGYSPDDIVGKIGIEQKMEMYLRGTNGTQTVEVDNLGRTMQILDTQNPIPGKDVYLTIDRDLQIECYKILEYNIAKTLTNTLSYYGVQRPDKDDNVTLMKDVVRSLFNSEIISIEKLEASQPEESQYSIYTTFLNTYNDIITGLQYDLDNYNEKPTNDKIDYYEYILSKLNEEGILKDGYKSDTYGAKYNELLEKKLSFKELLEIYCNTSMIQLQSDDDYALVRTYILDRILNYNSFKKMICMKMAKEERFNYNRLCLTLIEQGAVTATEDQIRRLKNGSLGAMEFIKEKILNLEITPQQLALDPCSGALVMTDVNTGEVLAMVSYPSYDNNRLVNDFDYDYYLQLLNDPSTPLYPIATQGKTAPGSTFKMLTAIAGMEEGVMGPYEPFTTHGLFQKVWPPAKCWIYGSYGGSHGTLTVASALEVSCNYFYYEVGYRLSFTDDGTYLDLQGIEQLQKYCKILGLGTKTGLEIDEAEPSLPQKDAVRASIGQSNNSYTPVQLARYVGTIANGGTCYELNVVDKVMDASGFIYYEKTPTVTNTVEFKENTMKVVHQGMYQVTQGSRGTARNMFKGFPIIIAGKTGTAQQSLTRPDHGLFVGYAPYDNPEVAVVCVVPFGYGSVLSPVAAKDAVGAYYQLGKTDIEEPYSLSFMLD